MFDTRSDKERHTAESVDVISDFLGVLGNFSVIIRAMLIRLMLVPHFTLTSSAYHIVDDYIIIIK